MNRTTIEGRWRQFRGKIKERWGRFRRDDLQALRGKRDQLVGKLQELYGLAKERAQEEVAAFLRRHPEPKTVPVRHIRIRIVRVRKTSKPTAKRRAR